VEDLLERKPWDASGSALSETNFMIALDLLDEADSKEPLFCPLLNLVAHFF